MNNVKINFKGRLDSLVKKINEREIISVLKIMLWVGLYLLFLYDLLIDCG